MENNPKLYDLLLANSACQYIDPVQDRSYQIRDFHQSLDIPDRKGLVFLYLDHGIQSVEVLLNFLRTGWAMALLSPKLNTEYKENLERLYAPQYIYDPERVGALGCQSLLVSSSIRLFRRTSVANASVHPDLKLLLSTSGSTGSPKFVKLSEENLVQNALSILAYLPITSSDVAPLNLPLFYSYGLSVFTTNALAGGSVVCTNRDSMQKEFWEEFQRYGYTSLAGVPYVYEMLDRLGFLKRKYPSLRYMTQAGGKLNEVLLRKFGEYARENQLLFYVMYGQTEATARMAYLPPDELLSKPGSIGKPIKQGRFELEPGSNELLYRGPNIFGGYASSLADLADFQPTEVLRTGDVGRMDEEGYYYITGRIKRFVKLFGTRINLEEVEQLLKSHYNGKTFLCLGQEDTYLLVAHEHKDIPVQSIKQLIAEKVKLHPNVIKVKPIEKIPLTPNGKVDYAASTALVLAESH